MQSDGTINSQDLLPSNEFYKTSQNFLGTAQYGDLGARVPSVGIGGDPGPVTFVDGFGYLVSCAINPQEDSTCPLNCADGSPPANTVVSVNGTANMWK